MLSRAFVLLLIGFCIGEQVRDKRYLLGVTTNTCPLGFIGYKSSCYLFFHSNATYGEAVSFCRYFDSRLAQISSKSEEDFIRGYLKRKGGGVDYYISGTDMRVEGIWTWENPLRRISYLNWYRGEPNNGNGRENCLELRADLGYMMNDVPCENMIRFVCEQKSYIQ